MRRIGQDVSDLAPEDRRDGAALFNLALGVFIATFAWWGLTGWFPDACPRRRQRNLRLDVAAAAAHALRLRVPAVPAASDGRGNNRVGIGFLIMALAGSGLAHIIGGQPDVVDGFDGLRRAGGMLGFLAAAPLALIHPAVPVAFYSLVAFTALLIVTATPFGAIPSRLRGAYEHLMGVDLQDHDGDDGRHDRSYLYENDAPAPKKKTPEAVRQGR